MYDIFSCQPVLNTVADTINLFEPILLAVLKKLMQYITSIAKLYLIVPL